MMPTPIDFVTERENWNIYQLEDGTVLKIKLILADVKRDGDNKDGSPKYQVGWQVAMHSEAAQAVKRERAND